MGTGESLPGESVPPVARERFEQAAVTMRAQQCQHLRSAAERLAALGERLSGEQKKNWETTLAHWQAASDVPKALEHGVQMAIKLPDTQRQAIDDVARQLQPELEQYRILKHQYSIYRAGQLAKVWPELNLSQKRERVGELLALDGEQSIWLLARRPFSSIMPLHETSKQHFDQYLTEKRSLLAGAYSELEPDVRAIHAEAKRLQVDAGMNDGQRAAASAVVELLDAPYGSSMRGFMLLEARDEQPATLRQQVQQLCSRVDQTLVRIDAEQQQLLTTLDNSLKALRSELAAARQFKELILIDTNRAEIARLWRPMRIYARRTPTLDRFEDAYLHVRRGQQYEIEFVIDGQMQTVARQDLWLTATEARLPPRMRRDIPLDGPGQPVTASTILGIEVQCHSPRGWQPAHVIDESPFGVEVIWQSTTDPRPILEPRAHLRK